MTHTFTVLAAFAAVGWSGAILLWMEGKRARRLAKQKTLSAEELYQSNQLLKPAINSPVGEQIAEFVGKVCVDIEYKVKELEQIRVKIAIPLATVVSEIQSTRLADRRERFEQYKTVLLNANSRLCSEIDSLMIAYDYLTNSAFSKIGVGLDKSLGGDSHEEVVMRALDREASKDEAYRRLQREIRKEFQAKVEENITRYDLERREKNVALHKAGLRPITAAEKFRSIRSLGQRDGFSAV